MTRIAKIIFHLCLVCLIRKLGIRNNIRLFSLGRTIPSNLCKYRIKTFSFIFIDKHNIICIMTVTKKETFSSFFPINISLFLISYLFCCKYWQKNVLLDVSVKSTERNYSIYGTKSNCAIIVINEQINWVSIKIIASSFFALVDT